MKKHQAVFNVAGKYGSYVVEGDEIIFDYPDTVSISMEDLWKEIDADYLLVPMQLLRKQRDVNLSETDWWAGSDRTMTDEQTAYRKALRDLPTTASPKLDENEQLTNVTWPTKPE
jgi:hypothetical protein